MTAKLGSGVSFTLATDADKDVISLITDMKSRDNCLFMSDAVNEYIKMAFDPDTVTVIGRAVVCANLAPLFKDEIAVTTDMKILSFVTPGTWERFIATRRIYETIVAGPTPDTLIAACVSDEDGKACVDMINSKSGTHVRTITDESRLGEFNGLAHLCVVDNFLFILLQGHCLYKVNLDNDCVLEKVTEGLEGCTRFAANKQGFLYFIKYYRVMVRSPEGKWRKLLDGQTDHGDVCWKPIALCIFNSKLVVSWKDDAAVTCRVYSYDFN